jgi:hypothetical protein
MSIGIRKKIVGLIAGGSLTLLGVFLPVGGASAATLKGLLSKDFWIGVGASAFYDKLLDPLLGALPGFTENTDLTNSAFESIGIETFIAAGGGVFYTGKNGKIADNQIAALVYANNQQVSAQVSRSFKIQGTSPEKAPYLIKVDVLAKTTNGFFPFQDGTQVNVGGITQQTGTGKLTGEQMYAGGFSFAFINGKFETIVSNFSTQAMKTQPVPEPLTMFGAAAALGYGAILKRKCSKKTES